MAQGKGKKRSTVTVAEEIAQPVLAELGLTLWDTRFEKEGATWYLRYFIDKPGGVNIQDCADMSRAVDKLLDAADPIEQSYVLEVCSPGIERRLTKDSHFQQYIGHDVNVRLIRPVDGGNPCAGKRDITGRLTAKQGDDVHILLEDEESGDELEMVVSLKECAYIKLYADFETGGLE